MTISTSSTPCSIITASEIGWLLDKLCQLGIDISIDYVSDAEKPWTLKVTNWSCDPYDYFTMRGMSLMETISKALDILKSRRGLVYV